ncbi:DUF2164 domain-containing protein [Wansuia hejianensis]|uniref:DUF2164 domain-containing protein n=1 Tax=Wansuia hejianensis TaxID=2763667 RepID=A0A926F329_9FIRM|nr:DUF2164 domain-containing protein [Wansuia hejianensis]MBC8591055.1 DUF2164 domain-containing protein [Wansuia hejianensis]
MNNRIKISKNKKKEMVDKIKDYFSNERNENIGDLAAELILDFFIKELGSHIYNQGIDDAYTYIKDKTEDLFALQIIRR